MQKRLSRSRLLKLGTVAAVLMGLVVASPGVSAASVQDTFELDGNVANTVTSPDVPDWQNLFTTGSLNTSPTRNTTLPSGFADASFFRDLIPGSTADTTTYATGSKDTLEITGGWQCKRSNNVTDKGDIQNTYMAAFRDPSTQDLIVYAGLEKNAPNGNNNMAVWLLRDGSVGCTSGPGNTDFTGVHMDGDVLLVAAFLNGGSNPVIDAYEWNNGALDTEPLSTGGKCGTTGSANLCAITNESGGITTPWLTGDKNLGAGSALGEDQFYEMGANLTQLGLNECFANYIANTRSSQELGATLYDFAGGQAQTCGSLQVKKYIDANMNGVLDTGTGATDVTTGTPVANWSFTVTGPNGLSCTGTTDSTGALGTVNCTASTSASDKLRTSLANVSPGSYTITETQKAGFFNTDPGANPNPATTVSETINLTTAGATVVFGNTCFVAKTFQVTNVPASATSVTARYAITAGPGVTDPPTEIDVPLAKVGTTSTWQAVAPGPLYQTNTIDWEWFINGDATNSVTGGEDDSLASFGYSTCAALNTTAFLPATISGSKFWDRNGDGDKDTGEGPLSGFQFKLMQGTTQIGATQTSAADGTFSFANVVPGSYTIVEQTPPAGWEATNFLTGQAVTVNLGDTTKTTSPFGNWPLSKIEVDFLPQAVVPGTTNAATLATAITCSDPTPTVVGSSTNSNTATTGNVDPNQSSVICTVTYVQGP